MIYCTKCLYNNYKPDIMFNDEGVCSACIAYDNRKNIDWGKREIEFRILCNHAKHEVYDCVIGVSGGKDSHYQVLKALEYGLNPLCVNARTDFLSDIGRRNLDHIANLGVDLIEVNPDRELRKKLMRMSLEMIGDISWTEHILIFTVPLQEAIRRNIKLVIFGENPQNEYAGPSHEQEKSELDEKWLSEFGGLNGLRVKDFMEMGYGNKNKFEFYRYPEVSQVRQIFLGHYFPWDGYENYKTVEKNGFEAINYGLESCGFNYENLDNLATGIHDYFKYLKFGFGRATDICNNHIRRRRMTRYDAILHIKKWDGNFPRTYLGENIYHNALRPLKISYKQFMEIANQFTNKELFDVSNVKKWGDVPKRKFEIK